MSKPINERMFDSRVVERHIARGLVTREQYDAYIASLQDDAEAGEQSEVQFVRTTLEPAEAEEPAAS